MSKAKAIYAWWRGLSIWIRVPLCIVLVIALIALIVEGAIRFVFPDKTHLRQPVPQTSAAQVERSSERLQEITEKADERIAEIRYSPLTTDLTAREVNAQRTEADRDFH